MTFPRLLLRNLLYHWRGNFAVFLGIALGSAVLTGALLVGDSLRGSLRALTLDRLGWVDEALVPGRFFRDNLRFDGADTVPVLLLQGNATCKGTGGDSNRVKVNVLGVNATFWPPPNKHIDPFWDSDERETVLNETCAQALNAQVGDRVTLRLQKAANASRETLMSDRKAEDQLETIEATVRAVVPEQGMARFSLKPTPAPVANAFVPLSMLQKQLGVAGRANALLLRTWYVVKKPDPDAGLKLEDWSLRYHSPKDRADAFLRFLDPKNLDQGKIKKIRWNGRMPDALADAAAKNDNLLTAELAIAFYEKHRNYWSLESQRMLLEPAVVRAIEKIAPERWSITPRFIYLADTLSEFKKLFSPYAIIASDDSGELGDDEIKLVRWPGFPFVAKPGNIIHVEYYVLDEKNHLAKKAHDFKVHSAVPLEGKLDDPDLTPEFPGITDKASMADWVNPPFPFEAHRVKKVDEDYWKRYRTTPKAYVNLRTAQKLWGTRFGDLTSIQVRAGKEDPSTLPKALLAELKPEQGGFVFQPVREQALKASTGSTDFGFYFLAFSSFLILSALLLVGLLVRLNIDRRASEIGVLLATGWDHRRVRWLVLGEGMLLALLGSAVGLAGAMFYADLMLKLLAVQWPGGAGLNFLHLHTTPLSFTIGYVASFVVSLATLYWATRVLSKLSPRSLLQGETTQTTGFAESQWGWSRWLISVGVVSALTLALVSPRFSSQEAQAGGFFGSGALLLTACLAGVWNLLKHSSRASSPQPTLILLGIRNAARHAVRSVLTVGLLAASSFLVVSVESFHKTTDQAFAQKTGGSGGFALYAEGSVPIYEDLNDPDVRRRLGLGTLPMRNVKFYPCRVQAGDDASCLNLYKPLKPRVMGLPDSLVKRGGFHFSASEAKSDAEKANPWLLLQKKIDDAIPAFVDANSAQYILNVSLGDAVEVHDGDGRPVKLRIVGLLEESIFQSEILISDANFVRVYPRQEGFAFQLIDTNDAGPELLGSIKNEIGTALLDSGVDVETTASRMQSFLAVENTYLATFQALGGLGLVLGAAGLAIVLLRGVWERRAELALLSALGFRPVQLAWLVLAENIYLLALGLASGTLSALLAVAPHLIGMGAHVLWLRIGGLLLLVLAVGLASAALAVRATVRTPVLTALRRE